MIISKKNVDFYVLLKRLWRMEKKRKKGTANQYLTTDSLKLPKTSKWRVKSRLKLESLRWVSCIFSRWILFQFIGVYILTVTSHLMTCHILFKTVGHDLRMFTWLTVRPTVTMWSILDKDKKKNLALHDRRLVYFRFNQNESKVSIMTLISSRITS